MFTFISYWPLRRRDPCATLASTAYYIGGIVEAAASARRRPGLSWQ